MYKCLNCGNEDKFYGIAKEQGNALIFQNLQKNTRENTPNPSELVCAISEDRSSLSGPSENKFDGNIVRGNLWAIQNNGSSAEITWAYIISEGSWKGFHEIRSCAVCNSTNITFL